MLWDVTLGLIGSDHEKDWARSSGSLGTLGKPWKGISEVTRGLQDITLDQITGSSESHSFTGSLLCNYYVAAV